VRLFAPPRYRPFVAFEVKFGKAKAIGSHAVRQNGEQQTPDRFTKTVAKATGKSERKNLEPAEFCYAMHRRKELYEAEFGSPKAIGARAANVSMGRGDANAIIADAYSTHAAELAGVSERTIQEAARIGKKIGKRIVKLVGTAATSEKPRPARWRCRPDLGTGCRRLLGRLPPPARYWRDLMPDLRWLPFV